MVKEKNIPKCFVWELTLRCNLRCLHCGSSAGKSRIDELTTEEALKLCEDLKRINTKSVALMGGEPFLRKDWYEIASKLNELKIPFTLITNGLIMNKKLISKLKEIRPAIIAISLDGGTAKVHDKIRNLNGAFKKAKKAVFDLKKEGFNVSVITTVTKINIDELPKIRDLILNKNIVWQIQISNSHGCRFEKDFMINKYQFYQVGMFISECMNNYTKKELPIGGADDMGYFSNSLNCVGVHDWKGCFAGKEVLGMQSNGNIKPCLSLPDRYIVSNIRDTGLVEIWNNDNLFKLNRKFKKSYLKGYCKKCKYGEKCQGGCSDIAYSLTGSPYNNPFCFYKIENESFNNLNNM